MRPTRPLRSVRLAAALLAGIATSPEGVAPTILALGAPAALLASLAGRGRCSAGLAFAESGVALAGWLLADTAQRQARARVEGWLPADGAPVETEIRGVVLEAPERDDRGEFRLAVRGTPTHPEEEAGGEITALLAVPGSDVEASSRIGALRHGDPVRVWCRLRRSRALRSAEESGSPPGGGDFEAVGSVKSARLVASLGAGRSGLPRVLDQARAAARRRLDAAMGAGTPPRAIVGAMLLGDRAGLGEEEQRALKDSGLVHVLSISGLHVGLVTAALLGVLRRLSGSPRLVLVPCACLLLALVGFVGPEAPVLRSALSALILLSGRAMGREGSPLNATAWAAVALAAARPGDVGDIGFQLSFCATASIVAAADPISRRLPLPRPLSRALATSVAAYVGTAPLLAWHFGRVAPAALLSNLVSVPLSGAVLGTGALLLLLPSIPGVSTAIAGSAKASCDALLSVSRLAGGLPGGAWRVASPCGAVLALWAVLMGAVISGEREGGSRRLSLGRFRSLSLFAVLAAVHLGPLPTGAVTGLEAAILDVGQGQAVALLGPSGVVLLDTGPAIGARWDAGERIVAPFLLRRGWRRVEAVVLSHDHDDHAGGTRSLLRDLEVGELWIAPGSWNRPRSRDLMEEARKRGSALLLASRGFRARRAGIPLEILHPPAVSAVAAANEGCLVVRAGSAPTRILVPADTESPDEHGIVGSFRAPESDALVVGHHGSAHSNSPEFLAAVRPVVAVVSAGVRNRFGHPDPSVLERLRKGGSRVYRTDRHGTVRLVASQRGWHVRITGRSEQE